MAHPLTNLVLAVTLECSGKPYYHEIKRCLSVPADVSFNNLAIAIQCAFEGSNTHPYVFDIYQTSMSPISTTGHLLARANPVLMGRGDGIVWRSDSGRGAVDLTRSRATWQADANELAVGAIWKDEADSHVTAVYDAGGEKWTIKLIRRERPTYNFDCPIVCTAARSSGHPHVENVSLFIERAAFHTFGAKTWDRDAINRRLASIRLDLNDQWSGVLWDMAGEETFSSRIVRWRERLGPQPGSRGLYDEIPTEELIGPNNTPLIVDRWYVNATIECWCDDNVSETIEQDLEDDWVPDVETADPLAHDVAHRARVREERLQVRGAKAFYNDAWEADKEEDKRSESIGLAMEQSEQMRARGIWTEEEIQASVYAAIEARGF